MSNCLSISRNSANSLPLSKDKVYLGEFSSIRHICSRTVFDDLSFINAAFNILLLRSTIVIIKPLPCPPYTVSPSQSPILVRCFISSPHSGITLSGYITTPQLLFVDTILFPFLLKCVFAVILGNIFNFTYLYIVDTHIVFLSGYKLLHFPLIDSGDQCRSSPLTTKFHSSEPFFIPLTFPFLRATM